MTAREACDDRPSSASRIGRPFRPPGTTRLRRRRRDLVELRDRYGHFVGGEWLEPRETYATIDPSSEEALAEVGQATSEEVDLAVAAARDAYENGWSEVSPAERAKYLYRIARILQERSREFAVLEVRTAAS